MSTPTETPVQSPPRKHAFAPIWWWVILGVGLSASFIVSHVEEAFSVIILFVTVLGSILILLTRYLIRGEGRITRRALPLTIFLIALAAIMAFVRIDDMRGNLIPSRVSWKWQPKPDERLAELAPTEGGADLGTQTADDFSQFLGPDRTNFVDVSLSTDWTNNPPEQIWRKEEFGAGWSAFSAVNGYAVTMEQRGAEEIVTCYEIASGDLVWATPMQARHATVPGGVGPRSTPTIYLGRVYSLGATGILLCLDGASGEVLWQKNLQEMSSRTPEQEFNEIQWGRAASPLIDEGRVIVPLGGPGGPSLVAFDAVNGDELWRKGKHQISYASPMVTTLGGIRQIVLVCESAITGHDAVSGDVLWEYPWQGNSAANASCSQPVAIGNDRLFFSKGYAYGCAVVKISQNEEGWGAEKIWHRISTMKTKFTNVVIRDGYVYGMDDSFLSCVDLENGKQKWKKRGTYGHGQVLGTGDHLLIQAESGDVALHSISPNKSEAQELARFTAIEGKTWNNPCLYGKLLLVRNGQQAACYRLP